MTVLKADRTLHLCIDFWKLNAMTQFDAFPMPQVGELLESIGQAKFTLTFDLSTGYWQIPLQAEDQA